MGMIIFLTAVIVEAAFAAYCFITKALFEYISDSPIVQN